MKKHIVTISGLPGSGKSSTARGVADKLGYEHLSSGDLFRKMAAERGISVEEINFTAEKQKEIDLQVDEWLRSLGDKSSLVIDSRTAFHWIPDSFKVFLDLDPETAARRTFAHIQREGRESQAAASLDEVRRKTLQRVESERKRYLDLYDLDYTDKKQFDLVVDTAANDLPAVINMVTEAYQEWLSAE